MRDPRPAAALSPILFAFALTVSAPGLAQCDTPALGCAQGNSICPVLPPPPVPPPPCPLTPMPAAGDLPSARSTTSDASAVPVYRGPVCNPSPTAEDPLLLAEIQVWHGLASHQPGFLGARWLCDARAYDSQSPSVIQRQIDLARAQGIDGFVIDWQGKGDPTLANHLEREFMDVAVQALFDVVANQAEPFCLALMYDEVGLRNAGAPPEQLQTLALADLAYADQQYLGSPFYLKLEGKPAVFVFPHDEVEPALTWPDLRDAFTLQMPHLIDLNPDPTDPEHDDAFDGFFAWVQPDELMWDRLGVDRGLAYLSWFYRTMTTLPSYAGKIAVGGLWPGFDDTFAPWTDLDAKRFMSRQERETYDETVELADANLSAIRMIATWNDYEEGSDTEAGIAMALDMDETLHEILIRSAPFELTWISTTDSDVVQVYQDCQLQCETTGVAPPVRVDLPSDRDCAYEIKVWTGAAEPLSRTFKIRRQDPDPTLLFFDDFESGDLSAWPPA